MADKTSIKVMGIIKDIMIKLDKFSFSADFVVVLDIKEYLKIPIILGRPFMKITMIIVDIYKERVKVRFKDNEVCFNMLGINI